MCPVPFLEKVAKTLWEQYQNQLSTFTIVLPNYRVIPCFQKYLSQQLQSPIWLPKLLSMDHFIQQFSQIQIAPQLILVKVLYEVLHAFQYQKESFEQFYTWGAMLLQDFDMLDKYLIHADHLFKNLYYHKESLNSYEYLTKNQQNTILSFWKSFDKQLSSHQRHFLQLWKLLPQVYNQFREELIGQNIGYQGLCYRTVWENIVEKKVLIPQQHLVFIGLNALSVVEERILEWSRKNKKALIYWDVDAYYMEDEQQEAGAYLRYYKQKQSFKETFPSINPDQIRNNSKNIQVFAVPSEVGQVQVIVDKLKQLIQSEGEQFDLARTAIVITEEHFLLPLLHALSTIPYPVHIASGYPLHYTAIYKVLEQLLTLQQDIQNQKHPSGFVPSSTVWNLFTHLQVVISSLDHDFAVQDLLGKLSKTAYIEQEIIIGQYELLEKLLRFTQQDVVSYVQECVSLLLLHLQTTHEALFTLNQVACYYIKEQLLILQKVITKDVKLDDFIKIFCHFLCVQRLPFDTTSSHMGIQVLPILEMGALDFDHLFILSMNEGVIPNDKNQSSFIPYSLRKGYDMPTADQYQVALYAYHFYRLLQYAKNIFISYSTTNALGTPGEKSRFLLQLLYESNLPIQEQTIMPTLQVPSIDPIIIYKDRFLLEKMNQWLVQDGNVAHVLTFSALNTYCDCSLKFYFQYILKLKGKEIIPQDIDPHYFGLIFHKTMQKLYTHCCTNQQIIKQAILTNLRSHVTEKIQEALVQIIYSNQPELASLLCSKHFIVQSVIEQLIDRILTIDSTYAPFSLLGVEIQRCIDFKIDGHREVRLSGLIDRVDKKGKSIRVIDYKTGVISNRIESIESLFVSEKRKRNAAALQVIFYAWLFKKNYVGSVVSILPAIMDSRSVFNDPFDMRLYIKEKEGTSVYMPVDDIALYEKDFEDSMRKLLQEIFDPAIPFKQREEVLFCMYCPYQNICQRTACR